MGCLNLQSLGAAPLPSSCTCSFISACIWTDGETKVLLDYYERYLREMGPMKRFKNYNSIFAQISRDLSETIGSTKTACQCKTRYKTILKRKRRAISTNNQSGASPCPVPYEEEMDRIRALDDSIEPEVQRDIFGATFKDTSGPTEAGTSNDTSVSATSSEPDDPGSNNVAERASFPCTARMKDMKYFFQAIENIEEKREKRHAEREERRAQRRLEKQEVKEERKEERCRMHIEKMNLIRALLEKKNE